MSATRRGLPTWRSTPADPAEFFTAEELDRSRRYQRPLPVARTVRAVGSLALLLAVLVSGVAGDVVDTLDGAGWPLKLVAVLVVVQLVVLVVDVPVDVWVDFGHDRRWGLSTQRPATFVADQVKSFVLSVAVGSLLLVPLYALIRSTAWWWLAGWALTTLGLFGFGFVFPVVIAPLFNRFESLTDPDLLGRVRAVADAAGAPVHEVLVVDESRRSRRDNAYVTGLGATRRVVLYDTLLAHPAELVEQVVAHELGHWRRHHLRQQLPLLAASALVAFLVLWAVASWDGLLRWLDLDGLGDPASLPLLLLVAGGVLSALGPVNAFVARAHEREADLDALDLLARPDAMAEMLRRLHVGNLADLSPGPLQRIGSSHPPVAERLAFVRRWKTELSGPEPFTFT